MSQLIPPPELYSLLGWFRPCFTRPGFGYFVDFVLALIAHLYRGTATGAYRTSSQDRHYTNFSRFLSKYRWTTGEVMDRLVSLVCDLGWFLRDDQGRLRVCLVVDETIVQKTSTRMYAVAWQRNTHGGLCRGTHTLGHYWLMLGMRLSIAGAVLCVPLGFRLYRQKKRCPASEYKAPCELAIELLAAFKLPEALKRPDVVVTLLADAGFVDSKLLNWCAEHNVQVIVRGRMDAQVCDLYVRQPKPLKGRPRKWGEKICLKAYAADPGNFRGQVALYQERTRTQLASVVGRHRASGLPIRFVIARREGKPDVVLMSTDLSLTPREVATMYADRFSIEMTFRELKQHFALGHYQVRSPEGMNGHVQLSATACALTQITALSWIADDLQGKPIPWSPMPWRKPGTLISVHETQDALARAAMGHDTFTRVAQDTRHDQNPPGTGRRPEVTGHPSRDPCPKVLN